MREIVLDTETTGLSPETGDRVVEIGCLEITNLMATGRTFHRYINPEMVMPPAAQNVHGLSDEFLSDKPLFAAVVDEFLEFISDTPLVIHNAAFDLGFINAELHRLGRPLLPDSQTVDTVSLARQKYPGAPASLDALCRRFGIDNSSRTLHGALLDAQLLAEVYLELRGGRQPGLVLQPTETKDENAVAAERAARPPRPHAPSGDEITSHEAFVSCLKDPIWKR